MDCCLCQSFENAELTVFIMVCRIFTFRDHPQQSKLNTVTCMDKGMHDPFHEPAQHLMMSSLWIKVGFLRENMLFQRRSSSFLEQDVGVKSEICIVEPDKIGPVKTITGQIQYLLLVSEVFVEIESRNRLRGFEGRALEGKMKLIGSIDQRTIGAQGPDCNDVMCSVAGSGQIDSTSTVSS
jgi:hypothetical protein